MRVDIGERLTRLHVGTVGEYHVVEQCRGPTVLARIGGGLGFGDDGRGAAHRFDVFLAGRDRRQRIERRRIGVVPAHIALIDRPRIKAHRAVIAAIVPFMRQHVRQTDHFGDFRPREAAVHQTHRLVVEIFVGIAVLL